MKLNCRVGDLALTLRANHPIPRDAIVRVVEFVPHCVCSTTLSDEHDVWIVEYQGSTTSPRGLTWGYRDKDLRPIRPGEGEDEMLRIAGLPAPRETTTA